MRKIATLVMVMAILFALLTGSASAAIRNVPGDYATIQAAVTAAVDGDTILVAAGTYTGTVEILTKTNITIQGVNRDTVIIKPNAVLSRNAKGTRTVKSPFYIQDVTGLLIRDVTFDFIDSSQNGFYGVFWCDSEGTMDNCKSINTSKPDPGVQTEINWGIWAPGLAPATYNKDNRAVVRVLNCDIQDGGRIGIWAGRWSRVIVDNCHIHKDYLTADFGYGIEIGREADGEIRNCTIEGYGTPSPSDQSASAAIYVHAAFTGS